MAKTKYVAYTSLGEGQETGTFVDPENYGGEDSENFQYMLTHRSVVPLGDPDAAIAMGQSPDVSMPDARDEEMEALKARIAELEAAKAASEAEAASGAEAAKEKAPVVKPVVSDTSTSGPKQS